MERIANAALLLASAVPFAALLHAYGRKVCLGWRIAWYLVLQAAYGVWSPVAIALFLLAVVLGVQFFWISVLAELLRIRTPERSSPPPLEGPPGRKFCGGSDFFPRIRCNLLE